MNMETDGNSSPLFQFVTLAKSVKTADRKNQFKDVITWRRSTAPQHFHESALARIFRGVRCFKWLLRSPCWSQPRPDWGRCFWCTWWETLERTLFGRTKSQGMLYLLNKSGRQTEHNHCQTYQKDSYRNMTKHRYPCLLPRRDLGKLPEF